MRKIRNLIGKKSEFKSVVVIGRSEEEFESIFNSKEIVNKISIEVEFPAKSKIIDAEITFRLLIKKIQENEIS